MGVWVETQSLEETRMLASSTTAFANLRGRSPQMRALFERLGPLAAAPVSVLLLGETGTGKELVARALHSESPRAQKPFVVLDCGAIPADLAEATIMGHRKGAFTGAVRDTPGCFEDANGGVLFLDELGELPLHLQTKLLRVLDRREVQRVGETRPRKVDVRVIAATNRNLGEMVAKHHFHLGLYHRLAQITLALPPLRERVEDIAFLANLTLREACVDDEPPKVLTKQAVHWLEVQPWEGNVRELKMLIEAAAHLVPAAQISAEHLAELRDARRDAHQLEEEDDEAEELFGLPLKEAGERMLERFQRQYCRHLLDATGAELGLGKAAEKAGYSSKGFRELLRRLGMLD